MKASVQATSTTVVKKQKSIWKYMKYALAIIFIQMIQWSSSQIMKLYKKKYKKKLS